MQSINQVECPKCGNSFDVSEILIHRLKESLEQNYLKKHQEIKKLQHELSNQQTQIDEKIEESVKMKLKAEKILLEKKLRNQLDIENSEQIKSYEEQLKVQIEKTKDLLKVKAEMKKLQRESEILKDQYEAEFQSKLTQVLKEETSKIKSEIEKKTGFKIAESELLINQLKTEIKNAQRRIDQGSQQVQGEAAEIIIEKFLKETFPMDDVTEYKKGERGADAILSIKTQSGDVAGKIIFECKRTKTWQKDWIEKFRDELRKRSATFGILVSDVYPKGISKLSQIEDVWVCSFTEYQNLTVVLRQATLLMHDLQNSQKNKGSKMELLHQFLCGPDFKNAVESILQGFTSLKTDLDKEKAIIQGFWKSRELQLDRVLTNTSDMYHSVKSIIGSKVPVIKQLDGQNDRKQLP